MAELFGLDIAGIVNDAITSAGGLMPLTLIKTSAGMQDDTDLTRFGNNTETRYSGQGYVRQQRGRDPISLQPRQENRLLILGGSLPSGVQPNITDKVELDGCTYVLDELVRSDPAAASYEFVAK